MIASITSNILDNSVEGTIMVGLYFLGVIVVLGGIIREIISSNKAKVASKDKKKENTDCPHHTQDNYRLLLQQIRQADKDIHDTAMSEICRRMQTITAAIFQEVEAHPEKKPQIERFMNYYLPTTLKLLKSYARVESQRISGQNMEKTKADIEGVADTLIQGFEKQLDMLYQAEVIDVAGDIRVIEKMMQRDGLIGASSDFGTVQ